MATTRTSTTTASGTSRESQSGKRHRALFLSSLLLCHFCHSYTVVSALQAKNVRRQAPQNSFPSARLSSVSSSSSSSTTTNPRRRQRTCLSLASSSSEEIDRGGPSSLLRMPQSMTVNTNMNRREVFSNSAKALFGGLATPFMLAADPANALLLRFPVDDPNTQPLKNKYHFIRAGTSELELEGIYSTNALFLTNRDNALSQQGYDCLRDSISALKKTSLPPTVVYHSLAANGMDTGDYIARELRLGRDRLLPEFTYLDQRGIGLWDSSDETVVRPAVWAMDAMEAGVEGFGARPPANTDGTPNDTLHDQFTRLRQFLSLQESRTAGEIILVIFPDGTGPALLSCMIAGIPFRDVHALEFQPGELRQDITPESVRALYEERKNDPSYLAKIEDGKEKLGELRQMKAKDFSVSFKDSRANDKQEEDNQAYYQKQQEVAVAQAKAEEERRAAMQEQLRLSRERAKAKEEQKKQEALAIQERKEQRLREQKALADQKKAEKEAAYAARKQALQEKADSAKAEKSSVAPGAAPAAPFGLSPIVLGAAGVGVVGMAAVLGGNQEEDSDASAAVPAAKNGNDGGGDQSVAASATDLSAIPAGELETPATVDAVAHNASALAAETKATSTDSKADVDGDAVGDAAEAPAPVSSTKAVERNETPETPRETSTAAAATKTAQPERPKDAEEEFATKLQAAEQEMKDALVEAAGVKERKQKKQQQQRQKANRPKSQPPATGKKATSSLFNNDPPVTITAAAKKTTNLVYEDDQDDSAWLQVLSEIRDEVEDEEEDEFGMVDYASLVSNDDTDFF